MLAEKPKFSSSYHTCYFCCYSLPTLRMGRYPFLESVVEILTVREAHGGLRHISGVRIESRKSQRENEDMTQ